MLDISLPIYSLFEAIEINKERTYRSISNAESPRLISFFDDLSCMKSAAATIWKRAATMAAG